METTKTCSSCEETKNVDHFPFNYGKFVNPCKTCKGKQDKTRRQKRRDEFDESKVDWESTQVCTKCGETKIVGQFSLHDGKFRSNCKTCKNEEAKARRQKRSKEFDKSKVDLEGTKRCCHCKQEKPKTDFSYTKSVFDGLYAMCKSCNLERLGKTLEKARDFRRKRKREMGPCVDCGENNQILLEFDHVRGVKKAHVSQLLGQKSLEDEIEKTEIRCIICHRYKTAKEKKERRKSSEDIKAQKQCRIRLRNLNYVNSKKTDLGGCQKCGLKLKNDDEFHFACFDFDHIDSKTKKAGIGVLVGRSSIKVIEEEMQKCQLLCAACHRIKTHEQLGWTPYE